MIVKKVDRQNKFISMFNTDTGEYMRTGIIKDGKDTGEDPFMTSFPELLDIGIMGHCENGRLGLCLQSGVQCYQNGMGVCEPNMTLDNFRKIIEECKGKVFQVALGGRGDPNLHENFEDILKLCRDNNIVPNFTTSGINITDHTVQLCKEYCGAVAVSWYRNNNTYHAIRKLLEGGVKTNIHYVLGKNTIDEAIQRLWTHDFPDGINAVIFLLHKPVGLGKEDNILDTGDPRLKEFFDWVNRGEFEFKIGFDSCSVPGIINFTDSIDGNSIDTCEGGRWSAYITSDMKMLPCSFDNQELRWAYDISNDTIQNAWNSKQFDDFRSHFKNSCSKCDRRRECMGGCPIRRQIVLCDREEKDLL